MSIDMNHFDDLIQDHMDYQPYEMKCSNCGKDLQFSASIDKDFDLKVEVDPCECLLEEFKERTK